MVRCTYGLVLTIMGSDGDRGFIGDETISLPRRGGIVHPIRLSMENLRVELPSLMESKLHGAISFIESATRSAGGGGQR